MARGHVTVAHVHDAPTPHDVYVGRAVSRANRAASPLGNPFRLTKTSPRAASIAAYAAYFAAEVVGHDTPAGRELAALQTRVAAGESLVLRCWCAPQACHGDVIAAYLNGEGPQRSDEKA